MRNSIILYELLANSKDNYFKQLDKLLSDIRYQNEIKSEV